MNPENVELWNEIHYSIAKNHPSKPQEVLDKATDIIYQTTSLLIEKNPADHVLRLPEKDGIPIFIRKDHLDWFKEMQDEGRTRCIEISTYPRFKPELDMEVEAVLQGVVFKKDFKEAVDKVIKEYEHWSDSDGNV